VSGFIEEYRARFGVEPICETLGVSASAYYQRATLELAIVEYVAWFNNTRLHEALNDRPPRELEELHAVQRQPTRTSS
jgi:transposase InsO family protein